MDFESPDSSAASAETSTASTDSTASAAVSEVSQPTPDGAQSAATPAESTLTFPEEISSLPGHEQRTNWQQLRTRYDETNRQLGELNQRIESFAPIEREISELGSFEQIKQGYELAQSLFAPVIDPNTGEPQRDPMTGLPSYSAAPFVERIASESPQTLYEISHRAMDEKFGNETVSHAIFRDYYGLDPALIETYRQIQSPADAAQFIQNSGQVTAEQLAQIPEQFHGAYKSLSPELRAEVDLMGDVARDQYLNERAELLENRTFREQQKAAIERQQQAEQAERQRQVEQRGEALIAEARNNAMTAATQKLKAEAAFFGPDHADNTRIHNTILRDAGDAVASDPALKADSQRCSDLYRLSAQYEANGDKYRCLQLKTEADKLASKLVRAYNNEVAKQVGFWSQKFNYARKGLETARAEANPRAEFTKGSGYSNGNTPAPSPQGPRPPGAGRLYVSDEAKRQIAANMEAMRQSRQ